MNCPFCAETVSDEALVCKFCRHDLTYVKQLHAELAEKTGRITKLEQALALAGHAAPETAIPEAADVAATSAVIEGGGWKALALGAWALLVPLALLVLVHYAFVFAWDLHVVLLRAATILIPLAWGFWFPWLRKPRLAVLAGLAALLGVASVLGMLAVSARIDGTPVLPTTAHDRMETLQVMVSIALGLGCGVLMARAIAALRARAERMRAGYRSAISAVRNSSREPEKMTAQADILGKVAEFAAPILSGAGAVLAGALSLLK